MELMGILRNSSKMNNIWLCFGVWVLYTETGPYIHLSYYPIYIVSI